MNRGMVQEPSYEKVAMLFLYLEPEAWIDFVTYKIARNFVEYYFLGGISGIL